MAKRKLIKQSKAKLAFRKGQSHKIAPLETLSKLRKSISIGEYKDCVQQFCIFGNTDASLLLQAGKERPEQLVGRFIGLEPLPLKNELYWATNWLETQTSQISTYLDTRNKIQDLILEDKFDQAVCIGVADFHYNGDSIQIEHMVFHPSQRPKMDPSQNAGATSTYAMRYALQDLFLLGDDSVDPDKINDGKVEYEPTTIKKNIVV